MKGTDEVFEKLNDIEIMDMIKKGDYSSFEVLFQRYLPVVKCTIKDLYIKGFDRDDFFQEARITFSKAIHFYDSERGLTIGNYFKLNLKHHFFTLVRKDMAQKRRISKVSESWENLLENGSSPYYTEQYIREMAFERDLEVKECLPEYIESLSEFECQVFFLHLRNADKQDIADELNCNVTQVVNALDRCKRKLKDKIK